MILCIDPYAGVEGILTMVRKVSREYICYFTVHVIVRTEEVICRGVKERRYELLERGVFSQPVKIIAVLLRGTVV